MNELGTKGKQLLRFLFSEIQKGRVKAGNPKTFISYSEALEALGHEKPSYRPGMRLQAAGLKELNEWTKTVASIPKIDGLIVNKRNHEPSYGYWTSHGFSFDDPARRDWWLKETAKAIAFDWTPYL